MGHLAHERERLVYLVDKFIEGAEESYPPESNPVVVEAGIVSIIAADAEGFGEDVAEDEEGRFTAPQYATESKYPHIQLSLFETNYLLVKGGFLRLAMDSDD